MKRRNTLKRPSDCSRNTAKNILITSISLGGGNRSSCWRNQRIRFLTRERTTRCTPPRQWSCRRTRQRWRQSRCITNSIIKCLNILLTPPCMTWLLYMLRDKLMAFQHHQATLTACTNYRTRCVRAKWWCPHRQDHTAIRLTYTVPPWSQGQRQAACLRLAPPRRTFMLNKLQKQVHSILNYTLNGMCRFECFVYLTVQRELIFAIHVSNRIST